MRLDRGGMREEHEAGVAVTVAVKADPRLSALVGSDVTTPLVERDQETDTRHLLISPNTFYTFGAHPRGLRPAVADGEAYVRYPDEPSRTHPFSVFSYPMAR
eukprot:scaffold868_cov305-Prasinococcus_capsulatus_cf.AAC.2